MLLLENLKPARKVEAPKDFRPALEFNGTEGFAITPAIPAGQVPDFEQFLLEQGFDPAEYEIVGAPRTSRWQKYDESWLTSYRFNFRKIIANSDQDLSLSWKTAKQFIRKRPKTYKTNLDKALVLMLADFQIGKVDSRGGHEQQLQRIFASYERYELLLAKERPNKIILADLGDIVEGFNSKMDLQQLGTNSMSLMNQVDVSISLILDVIKRSHKYCNDIVYATVASNHCQNRIGKQQVGLPGQDDWGVFIAKQIDRIARETEIPLKTLIPEPSDESLAFDVFEDQFHILGLWHGHQSARPEAVPSWWEKQAFGSQPVAAASIGLSGHFHTLRIQELGQHSNGGSRYWIQGKTMDNGSSWFRLNQGSESQPGLTAFLLEKGKHFTGSVVTL
jgi:hypothetical protein